MKHVRVKRELPAPNQSTRAVGPSGRAICRMPGSCSPPHANGMALANNVNAFDVWPHAETQGLFGCEWTVALTVALTAPRVQVCVETVLPPLLSA